MTVSVKALPASRKLEHGIFVWLTAGTIPDSALIILARGRLLLWGPSLVTPRVLGAGAWDSARDSAAVHAHVYVRGLPLPEALR